MKMRFRTDGWHYAGLKAAGETFENHYQPEHFSGVNADKYEVWKKHFDDTPKAEPGDVWRIHWAAPIDQPDRKDIAGYAICCIGCGKVHHWTTARNCSQTVDKPWGKSCAHVEARGSCWQWSGSAEDNNLTASPSLQVTEHETEPGGCNFHGHLENGDLHHG